MLWKPTLWVMADFVGAHPVGDGGMLWEPTLWAMGVEHALNAALRSVQSPSPVGAAPSPRPTLADQALQV